MKATLASQDELPLTKAYLPDLTVGSRDERWASIMSLFFMETNRQLGAGALQDDHVTHRITYHTIQNHNYIEPLSS